MGQSEINFDFNQSERDKLDLLFKKTLNYQFIDSDLKPAQEKLVNYYINSESIFSDSIPEKSEPLQVGTFPIIDPDSGLEYYEVTTSGYTHLRKYIEMDLKNEESNITSSTGGSWLPYSSDITKQNYMREILFPKFIFNINGNMSPIININTNININLNHPSYLPIISGGVLIFLGNPNSTITSESTIKLKNFFIYNGSFGLNNIPIDGSYVLKASLNDYSLDLSVNNIDIYHNLNVNGKTSLKELSAIDVSFTNLDLSHLDVSHINATGYTQRLGFAEIGMDGPGYAPPKENNPLQFPPGISGELSFKFYSLNEDQFALGQNWSGVTTINCAEDKSIHFSINNDPESRISLGRKTDNRCHLNMRDKFIWNVDYVHFSRNDSNGNDTSGIIFSGNSIINDTSDSYPGSMKNQNNTGNTPFVYRCLSLSNDVKRESWDGYNTLNQDGSFIVTWNFDINAEESGIWGFTDTISNSYAEGPDDLFISFSDFVGGSMRDPFGSNRRQFLSGIYIRSTDESTNLNFTGQHRCFLEKYVSSRKLYIGLIVNSSGKFININSSLKPSINEALPICKLCSKDNAKNVFGVISNKEDEKRQYLTGNIGHNGSKVFNNEYRFMINSLGEGGIWVSNKNGILENGDYITSSSIPGYGQKQLLNEGLLCNFTVAKITCDCNFNLNKVKKQKILTKDVEFFDNSNNKFIEKHIDFYYDNYILQFEDDLDTSGNPIYEYIYDTRFLDSSANILSGEEEYLTRLNNSENVYIACFVGCTYHCG